jgi:uncharacterized peroxidase-related enzyme
MKGQSKRRMSKFAIHTHESAPPDSKPLMQGLEQAFGFVPNVSAVLAESPATLKAYMTLSKIFDESAFTPAERQVVILAINEYNECHYCVAAHSILADMHGVSADAIDAIRDGNPIGDPRLEALRDFTRKIVELRGWVKEEDIEQFMAAGFSRAQVLEVILGVALKTISNYANHIADTPLDEAFTGAAWKPGR